MLTKEEAIQKHRELWNKIHGMTLRERTIIYKYRALRELGYHYPSPASPTNMCWACEYDAQKKRVEVKGFHFVGDCSNCLLTIPVKDNPSSVVPCMWEDSPYTMWGNARHYITAAYWAKVIADLPVNPDI